MCFGPHYSLHSTAARVNSCAHSTVHGQSSFPLLSSLLNWMTSYLFSDCNANAARHLHNTDKNNKLQCMTRMSKPVPSALPQALALSKIDLNPINRFPIPALTPSTGQTLGLPNRPFNRYSLCLAFHSFVSANAKVLLGNSILSCTSSHAIQRMLYTC